MLAVVEDKQTGLARQRCDHSLFQGPAGLLRNPDRLSHCPHHPLWSHRQQVDEPPRRALGSGCHFHGQAGLADTARAGQGHQPVPGQGVSQLLRLVAAAHKAGERTGCAHQHRRRGGLKGQSSEGLAVGDVQFAQQR
jgi:hypothetical protein